MTLCSLFLLPFVLFAGIILGILVYNIRKTKDKLRVIADTPVTDVKDLESGVGKVNGVAVALKQQLVSPMGQVDCIFYQFVVEEQRTRTVHTGGRHGGPRTETYWHKLIDDKDSIPCAVEDDTGRAELELLEAEVVVKPALNWFGPGSPPKYPHIERMLRKRYGQSSQGLIFSKMLKYTETVIREGDELFVLGNVKTKQGKPSYFCKGKEPFIVSDKDEKGVVKHYSSRLTWMYVGSGCAGVVLLGFLGVMIAALVVDAAVLGGIGLAANNPPPPPPQNAWDNNRDKDGQNPVPPQPKPKPQRPPGNSVDGALEKLRSEDAEVRRGGAFELSRLKADDARRDEVLAAIEKARQDPNPRVQEAAGFAFTAWERHEDLARLLKWHGPLKWEVKVDPPAEKPAVGAVNTTASVALRFNAQTIYPTSPGGVALATNPADNFDRTVQVFDMRRVQPVGKKIGVKLLPQFFNHGAISGDAAYLAGATPGARPTVEVWSVETGQLVHKLELSEVDKMTVRGLEFAGTDRLLTAIQKGLAPDHEDPTFYQVWDLKTGKEVCRFNIALDPLPRWSAVSPGGNYLALQMTSPVHGYWLVFIDLNTGKLAGKVEFQGAKDTWGQAAELAFSPDGGQIALLWELKKPPTWGRLFCFDVKTGKKTCDYEIGYDANNNPYGWTEGTHSCLQWLPDGSGWLLFRRYLLDRESGAAVWNFTTPGDGKSFAARHVLDRDHLSVITGAGRDFKMSVETIPWDKIEPELKKARAGMATAALLPVKSAEPPKDKPVDPGKDKPKDPPEKDPLAQALADLKSNEGATRKAAAESLAAMKPDPKRRLDVIKALQERSLDPDLDARKAVRHAQDVWFGKVQPDVPKDRKDAKAPENPVEWVFKIDPLQDKPKEPAETVEWAVKVDPLKDKPKVPDLNLKGSADLQFGGLLLYPTGPFAPVMATTPTFQRDSVQVFDLRQLKSVGKPVAAKFDPFNYKHHAVSPDGGYLAGSTPKAAKPTVEVWSTATGQVVHKLELADAKEMKVHAIDFPSKDRLLTAIQKGDFPNPDERTVYQVWDLTTGKEVCKFEYELCMHPKWAGVSPGGNYLALEVTTNEGYKLVFFDLNTGKVAGQFDFQGKKEAWGQAAGLAFSPDGTQLAMLWRLKTKALWGRLVCFDVKTRKKLYDHEIGYEPKNIELLGWTNGGLNCLQWVPDNSGWLLFSHILIDRESGAPVWKFGATPDVEAPPPRRFLDKNHMSVIGGEKFKPRLEIEAVPWDKIELEIKKAREQKGMK